MVKRVLFREIKLFIESGLINLIEQASTFLVLKERKFFWARINYIICIRNIKKSIL